MTIPRSHTVIYECVTTRFYERCAKQLLPFKGWQKIPWHCPDSYFIYCKPFVRDQDF